MRLIIFPVTEKIIITFTNCYCNCKHNLYVNVTFTLLADVTVPIDETESLLAHGISEFIRETFTKRSDGTELIICNGCGTVPIYNKKENFYICSLCDGPVKFIGELGNNLEILPSVNKSITTLSKIQIPYSFELLNKELQTYMNIYLRYLTSSDISHIRKTKFKGLKEKEIKDLLNSELIPRVIDYSDEVPFVE